MKITFYSGTEMWGNIDPNSDKAKGKMMGGAERAMLEWAAGLAALEHEVTVIGPCGEEGTYNGVRWIQRPHLRTGPSWQAEACDVYVACEVLQGFQHAQKARYRVFATQCNHYMLRERAAEIDMVVGVSNWHIAQLGRHEPAFHKIPVAVIPNGVTPARYAAHDNPGNQKKRDEGHKVVYSSSPDRGLVHLLGIWPMVLEALPDAELHVYYEVDRYVASNISMMDMMGDMAFKVGKGKELPRTFWHGPVNQAALANAQMGCGLLCYPCDTIQPTEGFGITVAEAIMAGCDVLTTDCDAFFELWADHVHMMKLPVIHEDWAKGIVEILTDRTKPENVEKRDKARLYVENMLNWTEIARAWETVLQELAA
jgi:glycosyltransferase involved in cell wall biosynthesis